jgi:hypothetical protein
MMSVDETEHLSTLLQKHRVLAVLMSGIFKKFTFYSEKRFRGTALNSCTAFLPSIEHALALAMVIERKGYDLLLTKLGEGHLTLLIAKCKSRNAILNNITVRVFKRGGVVIPKTINYYTPIALFSKETWREFELFELPSIKEHCKDHAYTQAMPVRRKDLLQLYKLKTVIERNRELKKALDKSGSNIDEIFQQLLQSAT